MTITEKKLKESEEKFRSLVETTSDWIWEVDDTGVYTYSNPKVKDILGYEVNEVIGKTPFDFMPPDEAEKVLVLFQKVKERKEPISILKNRNIHKNGYIVTLETSGVPFFDDNGTLMGYRGIDRNITEKIEAERKLKESEEKFRTLTEQSLMGICIAQNNQIKYINKAYADIFGYSVEEMMNWEMQDALKAIHPDDREFAIEQLTKKQKGDKDVVFHYQYRGIKKSGKIIWVDQYSKTIIFDEKPADFIMLIDITERKNIEEKLYQEQDLINTLLDNHPDFIYFKDINTRFQHISKRFCDYLDLNEEDIIGKTDLDLFPEEVAIQSHNEELNIIKTGVPLINKEQTDGETWVLSTKMPWLDKEGIIKGLFGISRDITEFKKVERNLKESEEKFRTLTEQSFLGISIVQDNNIKYVNNQLAHTFGYTVEEIMNWEVGGFLNVIHPEDREMVAKQARKKQLGESDSIDQYQFRGIKKNGDTIWLEIYSKSIIYNGKPADFATIHDITKGKIIEQKLLESEEKFRSIFETIPDLFFLVSGDTTILDYKGNLEELYLPPEEFLGKKLTSVLPEDVAVLSLNSITKTLETHEPQIVEYNLDMKGKTRFYEARHLYFTEDKVIVFIRDITERKTTQENLLISEKKYKESYDRANFYKDLFVHDMTNILQVINSSAELILFQLGDSEKSKNIANLATIMKKQIERGVKLISNVRTLSELEEEENITNRVEINKFINNAITFVKKAYERRNVKISFEDVSKKHYTNANELLQDVFENVLINGIKYNENSNIEISIKISKQEVDVKDYIKIEFIDNGMGVSDERKKVIFLKGNRELKGSKGMGLGLSLVSKILNIFKGEISVEDKIKGDFTKGSNFIILLPEIK